MNFVHKFFPVEVLTCTTFVRSTLLCAEMVTCAKFVKKNVLVQQSTFVHTVHHIKNSHWFCNDVPDQKITSRFNSAEQKKVHACH